MERALPILVAILLVRFVASEAEYQRARRRGDTLYFPAGVGLRLILGSGGPFLLYVTYRVALEARLTGEWWLPVLSGMLALGTLLFRPAEIRVDPDGIGEVGLFGLRQKRVSRSGAAASFIPGLREVLVVGSDGTVIKHTQYHVGQSEFLHQLEKHKVRVQS